MPLWINFPLHIKPGVDRIPTPKPSLNKIHVLKMIKDLWHWQQQPQLQTKILRQLKLLAVENERNKKYMVEAGVPKAMLLFIVTCFNKGQFDHGLEEALSILQLIGIPSADARILLVENNQIVESLKWVLGIQMGNHLMVKSHAVVVLRKIIETASSDLLQRLKLDFFQRIVGVLREASGMTQQGINAALNVLLDTCPWGRNRIMMVESGAVFELIEIELGAPEKRTTELILGILFHLCSCADGRAQFLNHKGGIAVVSKRILRVSPAADDRAIFILSLICKFSGTSKVIQEILKVGAVSKLCMLFQVESASYLKEKAREILRSHSDEWKKSPCVDASLLTRYTR